MVAIPDFFQVKKTKTKFVVSIDNRFTDEAMLLRAMQRLYFEYLLLKADFGEDVENLGREIKANWWAANQDQFLKRA